MSQVAEDLLCADHCVVWDHNSALRAVHTEAPSQPEHSCMSIATCRKLYRTAQLSCICLTGTCAFGCPSRILLHHRDVTLASPCVGSRLGQPRCVALHCWHPAHCLQAGRLILNRAGTIKIIIHKVIVCSQLLAGTTFPLKMTLALKHNPASGEKLAVRDVWQST